ncbi:MAG TPA: glycosyltransferase family 39 protein, partial [Candidatus Acidoferrales bacterium]|nr:glycosyltransferase family 39 protein [Candidatus Acidoferrales bacterium]
YFRDELYFAACGQHLAWGYVDQAPLIALVARVSRMLLGDSLFALRFFPALASGATVMLGGAIARELGGRRFAQSLAALAVLAAPIYLTFGNLLTMNAFEPLLWGLCALLAIRAIRTGRPRLWLAFGLVAGIGLENKHSMLFFGSGIFLGLLLTQERSLLRSRWIWLGGFVAFLLFLPNLLWQVSHAWPTLEFLRYRQAAKNIPVSALTFIAEQALLANPLAAPVGLAGLAFLFVARAARPYRFLAWGYLVVLAELILLGGKIYYLSPYDVILFGAGALAVERVIARRGREWWKPAILAPIAAAGLAAAPLAMPILPVQAAARYARFWHVQDVRVEVQPESDLPQLFADMFGWENQVAIVAAVFRGLPPDDRARAVILAGDYGEAAALDYFGPHYGLPKAVSAENAYYLWGPQDASGQVVLAFGVDRAKLGRVFGDIRELAVIRSEHAMPDENNLPVYVCRKPRMTFEQAWPILHSFG